LGGTIEPSIEPPLKKFKALFESSNPQKASQEGIESFSNTRTASTHGTEGWASEDRIFDRNGQHSPQWSVSASATGGEGPVDEEHSKKKRKAVADEGGGLVSQAIPSLTAKRQTTDIVSQRGKRPAPLADRAAPVILNDRESGIASGTPDTDAAFLKALASTKRGKRSEDDFDREFNQLRIHKPEFQRETNEDEWAVLADFGQDLDVRGNFMVVVDMPIRRRSKAVSEPTATQVEWQFRANFKRFKRVRHYCNPMHEIIAERCCRKWRRVEGQRWTLLRHKKAIMVSGLVCYRYVGNPRLTRRHRLLEGKQVTVPTPVSERVGQSSRTLSKADTEIHATT
jgi:hypothetical protein